MYLACMFTFLPRKESLGSASFEQFMILSAEWGQERRKKTSGRLFWVITMNSSSVLKLSSILRSSVRQIQSTTSLQDKGFFGGFFERKVETQQKSHSDQFAKKERIIELHSHSVKPDSIDKYLKNQEVFQGSNIFQGKLYCHVVV